MTDKKQDAQVETKPKATRRLGEEDLATKLDNRGRPVSFVEGSLVFVDASVIEQHPDLADKIGKQVVQKACEESGDLFYVATSDLHQCFYAPEMRKTMRNLKAKERREAAKAKREEDAAELADFKAAQSA